MSGKRSRTKGHAAERSIAKDIRHIFHDARRGLQYRDGADCPDVIAGPLWIESKKTKQPNIRAAMKQAASCCSPKHIPVAVTQADRDIRLVTMRWDDWIEIIESWWRRENE